VCKRALKEASRMWGGLVYSSLAPLTQKGPFWIKRGFSHVREPKYRCHATQEEVSLTKQPSRSVRGSILRIVATLYKKRSHCLKKRSHCPTRCNTLQYAATRCNTLQHAATRCNTLQHAATHSNTLHQGIYTSLPPYT